MYGNGEKAQSDREFMDTLEVYEEGNHWGGLLCQSQKGGYAIYSPSLCCCGIMGGGCGNAWLIWP